MDTKALRQKILDLAIRGKLVPQDPNDEPASVLLERIRAEKQQMVKDGKLKAKDIKNDTVIFKGDDNLHYEQFADGTVECIEEKIPFELPDGWSWSRLEPIASLITDYVANGSFASLKANVRTYKEKNYALFVRTVDLSDNFKGDLSYIDKESYDFLEKSKLYGGELMLSNIGASIGKVFKVPHLDTPMSLAPNAIILRFFNDITCDYFEYVFKSFVGQNYLQFLSGGAAMPKFNKTDLRAMIVPVPPIKEQERIVESVKNTFLGIDDLDISYSGLANTIQSVKSKILDLAIRGKLVPQDPNDEPASVLLERIRAEKEELIKQGKIKRDKKESVILKGDDNSYYEKIGDEITCIDDELPFEIPDSWCWARLNCISINYDSYRKPVNSYDRKNRVLGKSKDELYPYYGATGQIGFIDDFLFNGEYILLGEDAAPFLDKKAQKAYMIKGKSWVNNHAHILQSLVFPEYLTNCLNSIDYFNYVYGTTRLKLTQENMNRILVPVPSIEEQRKIAQAINNLFVLIESIKASLS